MTAVMAVQDGRVNGAAEISGKIRHFAEKLGIGSGPLD
jgi:hypothetical protein